MRERTAVGFVITGRVQGVGFRWSTRREVQLRGLAEKVDEMRGWLERGPNPARVDGIRPVDADPSTPEDHFRILR